MVNQDIAQRRSAVATSARGQTARETEPLCPRVDVRIVLIAEIGHQLTVALEPGTADCFRLLGDAASQSIPLDGEARRIVTERVGRRDFYLEQLYTVSTHEDGERVIVVAYLGLVWFDGAPAAMTSERWFDLGSLPPLGGADELLVEYALTRLRAKIGYTTIAFHLLPPTFTLPELQSTYEMILDRRLDKRNFRRRVIAAQLVEPTGGVRRDGSHRPAAVYRFRARHDPEQYLTPAWAHAS